jgi:26S proteasome regulatory subunit N12
MAAQLEPILTQLRNPSLPYPTAQSLLSKSKILLLQNHALTPTPQTSTPLLPVALEILELGALHSIRAAPTHGDVAIPAFIRYVSQLGPFYDAGVSTATENRSKITGLYLLLLLTQGRYAEFHSQLEGIGAGEAEKDRFLGYPIRLERWLMEGSYDRVWRAIRQGEVPSEEFGVFSEVRDLSPGVAFFSLHSTWDIC